ncbi:MAG: hypothetical protein K9M10_03835 [Candidatus Pacebacteria bacterium]|nr:hypothetical protein [Candidatus Paceibacterota bacterium]MCF7857581.1 hypothetical protein [Candidatus Paceibacterota bacterium]
MGNEELGTNTSEKKPYDKESQRLVISFIEGTKEYIFGHIDQSALPNRVKSEMCDYVEEFLLNLNDDGVAERMLVAFDGDGNIIRARSEEGVYDPFNAAQVLVTGLSEQFSTSIGTALMGVKNDEMKKLTMAIAEELQHHLDTQHLTY